MLKMVSVSALPESRGLFARFHIVYLRFQYFRWSVRHAQLQVAVWHKYRLYDWILSRHLRHWYARRSQRK